MFGTDQLVKTVARLIRSTYLLKGEECSIVPLAVSIRRLPIRHVSLTFNIVPTSSDIYKGLRLVPGGSLAQGETFDLRSLQKQPPRLTRESYSTMGELDRPEDYVHEYTFVHSYGLESDELSVVLREKFTAFLEESFSTQDELKEEDEQAWKEMSKVLDAQRKGENQDFFTPDDVEANKEEITSFVREMKSNTAVLSTLRKKESRKYATTFLAATCLSFVYPYLVMSLPSLGEPPFVCAIGTSFITLFAIMLVSRMRLLSEGAHHSTLLLNDLVAEMRNQPLKGCASGCQASQREVDVSCQPNRRGLYWQGSSDSTAAREPTP